MPHPLNPDLPLEETQGEPHFSDAEIFTRIWTSPRRVLRFINEQHYDKHVTVLLLLAGIFRAFDRASVKNMGDKLSIGAILAICIIAGGLFGWITYYLYAALLSWTGKWLKGQGNTSSILRILAYAMLPSVISLIFLIPQIAVYGNELFKEDGDTSSAGLLSNVVVYGAMFLEFSLAIVTVVFCVIGISEVQKLSIGKSIVNLLLPVAVIVIPLLALMMVAQLFN